MEYKLVTPAAIIAKFPEILEDQDWESLRDEFYQKFKISFLERIREDMVIAIVPEGRYESAKAYFKVQNMILFDADLFAKLGARIKN